MVWWVQNCGRELGLPKVACRNTRHELGVRAKGPTPSGPHKPGWHSSLHNKRPMLCCLVIGSSSGPIASKRTGDANNSHRISLGFLFSGIRVQILLSLPKT